MKFNNLFVAAFAALSLIATGCGGGGNNEQEDETITRTLLVGTGDSTTPTTKKWRTVFLKVNSNYVGTGADQACPVEVQSVGGGSSTSCEAGDYLELRSDGKGRAAYQGGVLEPDFDDTWTLTGDTLSTVNRTSGSDAIVVASFKLTNEGIVGGKQRIRMSTLSETEPDGETLRPGEVGFEFVIEEI